MDASKFFTNKDKYEVSRKWPEIVYPGSLIQQDHGEALDHGYCEWNFEKGQPKAEFLEIENKHGFYTLEIEDGIIPILPDIPEKPRLRLKVKSTNHAELKRVKTDLRRIYDVQEITINKVTSRSGSDRESLNLGDISSVNYQTDLIVDYAKRNFGIDESMLNRIQSINERLNEDLNEKDLSKSLRWEPVRFEFSNMFSYGEDNVIDFSAMGGTVGIFAENASGKSSIFGAICYCLFTKSPRTYKASNVLNINKDWFECKFKFRIDDVDYIIDRRAEKKGSDYLKETVEFYKIKDGEKVSLNGERKRQTDKIIRRYVGEYEDFILTTFSVQKNNTVFLDKNQSERKDILAQFLGIDIFDKLYSLAKDKSRDLKGLVKEFEKDDLSKKAAEAEEKCAKYLRSYEKYKNKKKSIVESKNNYVDEVISLNKKLIEVSDEDLDIEKLKEKKKSLEKKLENHNEKVKHLKIKKKEKEQAKLGLENLIENVDGQELESRYKNIKSKKERFEEIKNRINFVENNIEKNNSAYEHLINHSEFDPDCEYCVQRNESDAKKIQNLEETIAQEREELEELKEKKAKLKDTIENTNVPEKWNKFKEVREKINKHESFISKKELNISKIENKINRLKNEKNKVDSDISLYHDIKDKLEHNQKINEKIENKKKHVNELEEKIGSIEDKMRDIHGKIKVQESKKSNINDKIERFQSISKKYEAYEYYIEAVKRDGIPYELIEISLPEIEEEVNNILSQIVNFSIVFETDGKNINAWKVSSEDEIIPLKNASGMEGFVSSLAIRVALTNISNLPRSNFVAIDEGFGVLDYEKRNSLTTVFNYFKTAFSFVLFVTHLDSLRDIADGFVEVKKDGKFSSVRYLT